MVTIWTSKPYNTIPYHWYTSLSIYIWLFFIFFYMFFWRPSLLVNSCNWGFLPCFSYTQTASASSNWKSAYLLHRNKKWITSGMTVSKVCLKSLQMKPVSDNVCMKNTFLTIQIWPLIWRYRQSSCPVSPRLATF